LLEQDAAAAVAAAAAIAGAGSISLIIHSSAGASKGVLHGARPPRPLWHACAMNRTPLLRAALALLFISTPTMAKTSLVYIATQNPEKMGITAAQFDSDTGALSAPKLVVEARDPAHFTVTEDGEHLYLCNTGTPGGVSAFAVDRGSGGLTLLNYKESKGRGPSYVSVDATRRFVLDANYGGGFIEIFSLRKDGALAEQTAFVQHIGSSVHARQTKPYAHWVRTDPTNRFVLVADLGMDQVVIYRFDAKTGKVTPHDPPFTKVPGGMGPRHLAFHPNGKWAYAIAELANQVMAFSWDAKAGTLTQFQTVPTLAEGFSEPSTAAEIAVHANGRYLYASNRGEDTLVVYAIDAGTGELSLRQRVPSRGKVPRYFAFDPTNRWLLVSNQDGANVAVFAVDARSGELTPRGEPAQLVKPMGVVFAPN
jgi:6-phosphogluconolactonase